jgi:guanylate kinase
MNTSRIATLFVLSGPSGAGKDSVIASVRQRLGDLRFAVTATTRSPRAGEREGESYYFVTKDCYDEMIDSGDLLAPANVHGYWYGAPLGPIRDALAAGVDVLLKIDVQGAMQIKRALPQAVYIFLMTPTFDDLVARLTARHTEVHEELARRIKDASFEVAQQPQYDYCIVNQFEDLDRAVGDLESIVRAERLRIHRQPITLEVR